VWSAALESSVTDELGVKTTIAREIDILDRSVKVESCVSNKIVPRTSFHTEAEM
jgi:hypothetical protein